MIGFEWETRQDVPPDLFSDYYHPNNVGKDGSFYEIRLGLFTENPKDFSLHFFDAFHRMYDKGILPTGYHLSFNVRPSRVVKQFTFGCLGIRKARHYGVLHQTLFGYQTGFLSGQAKTVKVVGYPFLLQFKPLMASICPQQVLMDALLRNQMLYGMQSGTLKDAKIWDMATVMLSATPRTIRRLYSYPRGSALANLLAAVNNGTQ